MVFAYETRTEIYRFHFAVVFSSVLFSVLFQVFLRRYLEFVSLLDLPLLVVIYFGFSRRNPSTGLLLGMVVGVLQDALGGQPIGLFGMAKTLVGFLASSLSSRVDTDHAPARLLLVFVFYAVHHVIYTGSQRWLLGEPAALVSLRSLEAALVNSLLAVLVFLLLDRFRRTT